MTRDEKIERVRRHAKSLVTLADSYERCAEALDMMSDAMVDVMYDLKEAHQQLHTMFADIIDEANAP